jgi:DNA-binding NtrC family response regulator
MNTKPTILVVDDEDTIRKLLKARFEREGFNVNTAGSAEEGSAFLASNPECAVVVTDVRMPGKDGLAFTAEIKQQFKHTKVIVMTGHGEKSTAIQALRTGASDYLEKPFDLEEMTHALKRTVNEYELEMKTEAFVHELEVRVERAEKPRQEYHATPAPSISADAWSEGEVTSSYTVLKKKWSEAFEKEYLCNVLEKHQGNVTSAAKEASVDRSNFLRLLRRHHIDAAAYRSIKKAA